MLSSILTKILSCVFVSRIRVAYNTNMGLRQMGFRELLPEVRKQHYLWSETRRNQITLRLQLSGPTMPEHFRFTL